MKKKKKSESWFLSVLADPFLCLPVSKNEFNKRLPFWPHQPQAFRHLPWGCSEVPKHLFLAPGSSLRKQGSPCGEESNGDSIGNELLGV